MFTKIFVFLNKLIQNIPINLLSKGFPGKKMFQDFAGPIDWLKKAGLVYQVPIIDTAKVP